VSSLIPVQDDTLVTNRHIHRTTLNAQQSPLLCLPREIRDMIWQEAMGGSNLNVHIKMKDGEFINQVCNQHPQHQMQQLLDASLPAKCLAANPSLRKRGDYFDSEDYDAAVAAENEAPQCCANARGKFTEGAQDTTISPVDCLIACRQIHAEALPFLYSHNFSISDPNTLKTFLRCRTEHQLRTIKSLSLSIEASMSKNHSRRGYFRTLEPKWKIVDVYDQVAGLSNLKTLNVFIERGNERIADHGEIDKWTDGLPSPLLDTLTQFRLCPLENVSVSIGLQSVATCEFKAMPYYDFFATFNFTPTGARGHTENQRRAVKFPRAKREVLAEHVKKVLLDGDGKKEEMQKMAEAMLRDERAERWKLLMRKAETIEEMEEMEDAMALAQAARRKRIRRE
jgi:hypothetical protein